MCVFVHHTHTESCHSINAPDIHSSLYDIFLALATLPDSPSHGYEEVLVISDLE